MDKINKKQFYGDRNLVSYSVPETVTEIGDWAFARCRKLKRIAIPRKIKRIGREAFAECESLVAAYFYEGHWNEAWDDPGTEGELMALAMRYFPEVQRVVSGMQESELTVDMAAADASGWLRGWDEACGRFLQRPDEEGFVPFLAGGEEDYADDGESLAAHCRKAQLTKAKMAYRRLLADQIGAERGFGLPEELRLFYQAALRENDGDFAVFMDLEDHFREAARIYEAVGILTQEKIGGLLERLPEDLVELRALLMGKKTGDFLDGLVL